MPVSPLPRKSRSAMLLCLMTLLASCGTKVNTGRNKDPSTWPPAGDLPQETAPGPDSAEPANPSGPAHTNLATESCFKSTAHKLSPALEKVCSDELMPNPLLAKIYDYLCVRKYLTSALNTPSCGWRGDPANLMQFAKIYEREPESSGKNYEDVHATMVHLPVSPEQFIDFVRLAFENFPAFKAKGFTWLAGTREITNLNQGTLDAIVDYKFRVERDVYDLAYVGHIKLVQLDPNTWIHINYADRDFTRVLSFAQVVFYSRQSDGSALVVKLEHKGVDSSGGLYKRAWQGAIDLLKDFMNKSWSNMVRG